MAEISAVFAVHAGTYAEMTRDVSGLTAEEMAEVIEQEIDVDTSVCHQCANKLSDPTPVEMVAFTVDGVEYSRVDGKWVPEDRSAVSL